MEFSKNSMEFSKNSMEFLKDSMELLNNPMESSKSLSKKFHGIFENSMEFFHDNFIPTFKGKSQVQFDFKI